MAGWPSNSDARFMSTDLRMPRRSVERSLSFSTSIEDHSMNAKTLLCLAASASLFIPGAASALCMKYPAPAESRAGAIGERLDKIGQPASAGGPEHPCNSIERPDPVGGTVSPAGGTEIPPHVYVPDDDPLEPVMLQLCFRVPTSPLCRP